MVSHRSVVAVVLPRSVVAVVSERSVIAVVSERRCERWRPAESPSGCGKMWQLGLDSPPNLWDILVYLKERGHGESLTTLKSYVDSRLDNGEFAECECPWAELRFARICLAQA